MTTRLDFDVLARDRGASATFNGIANSADRSGDKLRKVGAAMKYAALGVAGGVALVVKGGYELAQSAAMDEVAAKAMALQFRNSADATRGQVAATEEWISKQGTSLGIMDDELRPALSRLVAVNHDVAQSRRDVTIAENVAAGTGKSLASVTAAVAKGYTGSTAGLAKLGVQTKDAQGDALTLNQIMKNLSETYSGQATKAAGTAAGQFGRLKVIISETGEEIGYKLLPYGADLADFLLRDGVPALSQFSGWVQTTGGDLADQAIVLGRDLLPVLKDGVEAVAELGAEFLGTAAPIAHDLLPAVSGLADHVGDLVGWFHQLPGPVKETAIEVGVAALIVPRLSSAVTGVTTSVTTNIGRLQAWRSEMAMTGAGTAKLASAARTAAGIAGVLALVQASDQSNEALQGLAQAAGLAALGFSVGGPIGAAVGFTGSALYTLYQQTKQTNDGFVEAKEVARDYASTLDDTTGAITRQTRAMILQGLQDEGLLAGAGMLGIATRDLIGYTLGNEGAIKRVNRAYADNQSLLLGIQGNSLKDWLYEQGVALRAQGRDARQSAADLEGWKKALRGVPPKVQVRLENLNYEPTHKQWLALNRQIELTPKQKQIVIKALGYDPAMRQTKALGGELDKVGNKRGDLSNWERGLLTGLTGATQTTRRGVGKVSGELEDGVRAIPGRVAPLGRTGGQQVGDGLQSGIMRGFAGTSDALAAEAAEAVRHAISAAKAAGRINSPSKETEEIGEFMGDGLIGGLASRKGAIWDVGHDVMFSLTAGINDGQKALQRQLDQATNIVSGWRDKVKSLVADSRSYVSGFQSFGTSLFGADIPGQTVTMSGKDGNGIEVQLPQNIGQLFTHANAQASQAQQVREDVQKLIGLGLSDALLKQLQTSPGGVQQIHTLAGGTSTEIAMFNQLNKQTQSDYRAAGLAGAQQIYGADIRGARGHLTAAIDEKKLAEALVKAWEKRDKKRKEHEDKKDRAEAERHRTLVDAVGKVAPGVAVALDGVAGRAVGRK